MRFPQPDSRKTRPFPPARRAASAFLGAAVISLLAGAAPQVFAQAQQTPIPEEPSTQPQIEIAGTGVATLDLGRSQNALPGGGKASGSQINISDSALMFGAAQRLYNGGIGSFSLGGLSLDESNTGHGTQLFLHQAYVDYQNQNLETYLGRTDQPTGRSCSSPRCAATT